MGLYVVYWNTEILKYCQPTLLRLVKYEGESVLAEGHHLGGEEGRQQPPGPVSQAQVVLGLPLSGGGEPPVHQTVHSDKNISGNI